MVLLCLNAYAVETPDPVLMFQQFTFTIKCNPSSSNSLHPIALPFVALWPPSQQYIISANAKRQGSVKLTSVMGTVSSFYPPVFLQLFSPLSWNALECCLSSDPSCSAAQPLTPPHPFLCLTLGGLRICGWLYSECHSLGLCALV